MLYNWYQNYDGSNNANLPPPDEYISWQSDFRTITGIDGVSATGLGVGICVVDTGIDLSHQDFGGRQLAGWKDFIQDQETPYDDQGHGTAMSGLIWADGWMKGVSPNADLYVAKAMNSQGEGVDETIAAAVDWCVDSGVDIISMSLGGAGGFNFFISSTDELENSVDNALSQGVFVVAAAGNDGENDDGDVASPGSVEDVICVGGIDRNGMIWSGSSSGDNNGRILPLPPILPRNNPDMKPEVTGPGKDVPVMIPPSHQSNEPSRYGPYAHASGTSAATAWVAGGIALLLEEKPELAHNGSSGGSGAISDVKQWLSDSATGQDGHDDHYGYGVFNVQALISTANS
jgi:serine protease AprX